MTELVICFSMWAGLCNFAPTIILLPDFASCVKEREYQTATIKKLAYALCRPVKDKP